MGGSEWGASKWNASEWGVGNGGLVLVMQASRGASKWGMSLVIGVLGR